MAEGKVERRAVSLAVVILAAIPVAMSTGCAHTAAAVTPPVPPPTEIPVAAPPPPPPGSLWNETGTRALIGMNGNARQVGDLITVVIDESASTTIGATTDTSRSSDSAFGIDALLGADTSILQANPNMGGTIGLGGTSENAFSGDGETSRDGSLSAVLTCSVVEVMANGNLRIRGTKEVRVNREIQYLTLEGVVRPRDIRIDNTIQSNLIADVRVEFTGNGVVSDKQGQGWGTRIADHLWPF